MAVDLSALSAGINKANSIGDLVLVTPNSNLGYQPQNAPVTPGIALPFSNPPSFVFDYEGDNTVTLESDVTDHWVENNTTVQDQVALRPEVITVHGFVGELNDILPDLLQPIQFAADKLFIISAYQPQLSLTALRVLNKARQTYAAASDLLASAVSVWNTITGDGPVQTKQQKAFTQFYGYWNNRTLFTIQTPWAIFKNSVIKSLRANQDATTRMITDFEITFKVIRFSETESNLLASNSQGRLSNSTSATVSHGTSTPLVAGGLTSQPLVQGIL